MLLFSTMLQLKESITKEEYLRLVLEWNQKSPYEENIIHDITWNGEHVARFGTDKLWMEFMEYDNILAVRYEKTDSKGVIWDSDYVMNFDEMKVCIQLDRSYSRKAATEEEPFSTPAFISLLMEKDLIRKDGTLPVKKRPITIRPETLSILTDVINGYTRYAMPVVFVSRTIEDTNPVDADLLASKLKGVAHVLVQQSVGLNWNIRNMCRDSNEFNGTIGIYYPQMNSEKKRFRYYGQGEEQPKLLESVVQEVVRYSNSQKVGDMYTWLGVYEAVATRQREEREQTYEAMVSDCLTDQDQQDRLLRELERQNRELQDEIRDLKRHKAYDADEIVLGFGEEKDLFPGEIRDIVLSEIEKILKNTPENTRRAHVLKDLLNENNYQGLLEERKTRLKSVLKGYRDMSPSVKSQLAELGLEVTNGGKHYKVVYYGDERYRDTMSKTASDAARSGDNAANDMIRKMM